MIDRETRTVWTHLDGKAVQGEMEGERLAMVPMPQTTWGEWKALHPSSLVLSPDTDFRDRYGRVRIGVFNPQEAQFGDDRLPANALVVGVEVDGRFRGYPLAEVEGAGGVVNDVLAGLPIVVIYDAEARTGIAYSRVVRGRTLEFSNAAAGGVEIRDRETDSTWDHMGRAASGPLAGAVLTFVPSFISEWYGWSGYHPETGLFGGAE